MPAAVDLLTDGAMHSHLYLYHNILDPQGLSTRAQLSECHDTAHRDPWTPTAPHTHADPAPVVEWTWNDALRRGR